MGKKKLLIVNQNLCIGGVQNALLGLVNQMRDAYEIELLLFAKRGEYLNDISEDIKIDTAKSSYKYLAYSQQDLKRNPADFVKRGIYAFIAKKIGFQYSIAMINHAQKTISGAYDAAISFSNCAGRYSFYGGPAEFVLNNVNAKEKICYIHCDYLHSDTQNPYNDGVYLKFDKIACVSNSVKNRFLAALPALRGKTYITPNFHDYNRIALLSEDGPVPYDKAKLNVVIISRLGKEKGVDRAIEAVRQLPKDVELHIVGDGLEKTRLCNLVHSYGLMERVHFYGQQENPYKFMKHSDLLLLPSFQEAAPMVFKEAAYLGLPVVTTDTTSADEFVGSKGAGIVVPNATEGIRDGLAEILRDRAILFDIKKRLSSLSFNNTEAEQKFKEMIEI